jgi:anti-sigma B factor antagonist
MRHKVEKQPAGTVVALEGDIDLQSSPEARQVLLEAVGQGGAVYVDLSNVGYIDSSGIASLVEALQSSRRRGGEFMLAGVSEPALRVLQLARLDKVFRIYPTLVAAMAGNR